MNTLINFLFYPYERPVSRTNIRKVGIVLSLIGLVIYSSTAAPLILADLSLEITLVMDCLIYLSFITFMIGLVMVKTSFIPAHRSPTLLYRMRMGIVTFMVAIGLLTYIVFFSGLPDHYIYISIVIFFVIIISIAVINMRLQTKYRRLEIEERKASSKSQQIMTKSEGLPDYNVPFKGIRTVKRRKILTLLAGLSFLFVYPFILFMLTKFLDKEYPGLHSIGYICLIIGLILSNSSTILYNKWKKEEANTNDSF